MLFAVAMRQEEPALLIQQQLVQTNPVFVELDGKPIRASKKSSQCCLDAVDACWQQKSKQIRGSEQPAAAAAYEHARAADRAILAAASDDPQ